LAFLTKAYRPNICREAAGADDSLGARLDVRAQERRVRRQLLADKYRDAQLAAEVERAAEAAAAEAALELGRRDKALCMREHKEAEERLAKRKAAGQAKIELANLHARRALLQGVGWRPWRALVLARRRGQERALSCWRSALCATAFGGWGLLAARARARRGCARGMRCILALRLDFRVSLRRGLVGLHAGAARQADRVAAAQYYVRETHSLSLYIYKYIYMCVCVCVCVCIYVYICIYIYIYIYI